MIFLISLRNIIRGKKNSVIITLLIAVITFLFFIGNSVIAQSERGLRESYTESLTGDIVIEKNTGVSMSLFGANAPHLEDFFLIETLGAYNNLIDIVSSHPAVKEWTSQVSTGAQMRVLNNKRAVYVAGVEGQKYFSVLSGIELEEGAFIDNGGSGVMLNRALVNEIEAETGKKLKIGEAVVFTTSGRAGFKIRTAPLTGIYSYKTPNSALENIVLLDAQNARALAEIRVASANVAVSDETEALLDSDNFGSLFESGDELYEDYSESGVPLEQSIYGYLHEDTVEKKQTSAEERRGGDWNFIIIKLKKNVSAAKTIFELNKKLSQYGAAAVGWRTAAGVSAIFVLVLQALYNAGIFIVCVAGIIAIINILLIAVFKRTREIGTLRALGASGAYIRVMLCFENCILGCAGGILGIALGGAVLALINSLQITINNSLIVRLLGVKELYVMFLPEYALYSAAFSLVLTLAALVFPVETAVRIEPVVAIREG
ncbi:MAG: FtsX-like permease family protein [Spirochaetaceae bacterium]|jgi:ABC-type lipoprotein release transport system permease subunit|nr:FtsX-like permease family protein [Spirochaetaceae bacterium]